MKRILTLLFTCLVLLVVLPAAQAQVRIDSFNVDGVKHVRTYKVSQSDSTAKEIITEKRFDATGKLVFDGYVEQYWENGLVSKRILTQVKMLPGGTKEVLEIPLHGKPSCTRYDMHGRVTERKTLRLTRALGMAEF